jgi:hypothetical protein
MILATKATRPRKKTHTENTKAVLRLRRQLEDFLLESHTSYAERCFVKQMIDFLYRVSVFDRDIEIITDSVRSLTLKRRLQVAFSNQSMIASSTYGEAIRTRDTRILYGS